MVLNHKLLATLTQYNNLLKQSRPKTFSEVIQLLVARSHVFVKQNVIKINFFLFQQEKVVYNRPILSIQTVTDRNSSRPTITPNYQLRCFIYNF